MTQAKLSREHALALLNKLANDDEFRARFEVDPAGGLRDLGVPHATVVAFPPASVAPLTLPSKSRCAALHTEVAATDAADFKCMNIPNSWFT